MTLYASPSTKGFYDSEIHISIPFGAVEITRDYHQTLIQGQSEGKIIQFNTVDGIPVLQSPPERTLGEKQADMWTKIKSKRDLLTQTGGFKVGDHWFHSDTFSRSQHIGMAIMGESLPTGIMWKTMAGEFIEMTPSLAAQIFSSAVVQDGLIFAAAEVHRSLMMQADDPSTYDFTSGWPEVYQSGV